MGKQTKEKTKKTEKMIYEKPKMNSLPLNVAQAVISDCSPGAEMTSPWHPCKSIKT